MINYYNHIIMDYFEADLIKVDCQRRFTQSTTSESPDKLIFNEMNFYN